MSWFVKEVPSKEGLYYRELLKANKAARNKRRLAKALHEANKKIKELELKMCVCTSLANAPLPDLLKSWSVKFNQYPGTEGTDRPPNCE